MSPPNGISFSSQAHKWRSLRQMRLRRQGASPFLQPKLYLNPSELSNHDKHGSCGSSGRTDSNQQRTRTRTVLTVRLKSGKLSFVIQRRSLPVKRDLGRMIQQSMLLNQIGCAGCCWLSATNPPTTSGEITIPGISVCLAVMGRACLWKLVLLAADGVGINARECAQASSLGSVM